MSFRGARDRTHSDPMNFVDELNPWATDTPELKRQWSGCHQMI